MAKGSRGGNFSGTTNPNIVTMIHYTPEENIESLLKTDFDMSRAGEGAGTVWGNAAYFLEKGSYEDDMYSVRLDTNSYIESNIDTTNMLTVDTLRDKAYGSTNTMYDDAAKSFPKAIHRDYTRLKKQYGNQQAFEDVAKMYYSGVIINHKLANGYIDPLTGGSQVVVYDTSVIKNRKAGKNK